MCSLGHSSHVRLFATLWTVAHQAPLSMGILQARILEWVDMSSAGVQPQWIQGNSKWGMESVRKNLFI